SWRLQLARMSSSEISRGTSRFRAHRIKTNQTTIRGVVVGRIGIAFLAAILPFISLRAQSPGTAESGGSSILASSRKHSAREAYEEVGRAESVDDWETALRGYQEAAALSPGDRAIEAQAQVARSALAQQRTEQAERQLLSGNPALARAMLQSAIELDPSYTVAQERLQQLAQAGTSPTLPTDNLASTLPAIEPNAGTRNFDYNGGTHGAYEEVARQFGIIAAFD